MSTLLDVEGLSIAFGGVLALDGVSLAIRPGEVRALIGPNGSGKTTLINVVTGIYRPTAGRVSFAGHDLLRLLPHSLAGLGLARTFQNLRLFPRTTVLENVLVGLHARLRASVLDCILSTPRSRREEREAEAQAHELLRTVGLDQLARRRADGLAFGHQRLLEIARALGCRPKLLLLDEPGAGMTADELDVLAELIRKLRADHGMAVLLVAHTMRLVMGVSDRVSVLDHGSLIAEGEPAAVVGDPRVIEAYLGQPDDGTAQA